MFYWKNIVNFGNMQSSIDFLPERIQRDLYELVGLIRDEVRDVVMIILMAAMPETPMWNWIYSVITAAAKSSS